MRPFHAIRSIAKNEPSDRGSYPNVVVYFMQRRIGMRFRIRRYEVVQTWNPNADLNAIDRGRAFSNSQQPLDTFIIFAKCSEL